MFVVEPISPDLVYLRHLREKNGSAGSARLSRGAAPASIAGRREREFRSLKLHFFLAARLDVDSVQSMRVRRSVARVWVRWWCRPSVPRRLPISATSRSGAARADGPGSARTQLTSEQQQLDASAHDARQHPRTAHRIAFAPAMPILIWCSEVRRNQLLGSRAPGRSPFPARTAEPGV